MILEIILSLMFDITGYSVVITCQMAPISSADGADGTGGTSDSVHLDILLTLVT